MQTILTYLMLVLTALVMHAQNTVEVSIKNFKNSTGSTHSDFLEKTYKTQVVAILKKKAVVTFADVPDGTYAISAFHDENENGKFDMYFEIFPKEPYACSNGATGFFGPPKWNDAKFEVKNGEVKRIEMNM